MDPAVESVLSAYHERAQREQELLERLSADELGERVNEFLLPIGPEAGRFLNLLIKAAGCRHILEVGTSFGYSTVWFAEAARATGGRVTSLDLHAHKQEQAWEALRRAGLAERVEFIHGDAMHLVPELDFSVDFVLLDLWKSLYVPLFDLLRPRLADGALIAADNILNPEAYRETMRAYTDHVRATPGIESVLVPIGNGIELSRYQH